MHRVVVVLVEVLIIIGLSRIMGLGCRFLKQPLVIGEIIAGIMLGSSVVLFKVVSAYGETHLKAPPAIGGSYQINAQKLPGCLKSDALVLDIKQFGVYLFASLLPAKTDDQKTTIAEEKPSMNGRFNNQQLSLEGSVPWITKCNKADGSRGTISVKI
ncbi:MAG TPA: hypothetical protein DCE56_07510 [Cyanobacteria bacterium UBA8553]|nr:hypothetical protein [Cyanobacteria bacterium UBA8553]HAJ60953.1 hypothetical protein [Cyanobacteria bacterium UBA8543]